MVPYTRIPVFLMGLVGALHCKAFSAHLSSTCAPLTVTDSGTLEDGSASKTEKEEEEAKRSQMEAIGRMEQQVSFEVV